MSLEGGAESGMKRGLGRNPLQSYGERAGLREARGGATDVVWDGKATRRREGVAPARELSLGKFPVLYGKAEEFRLAELDNMVTGCSLEDYQNTQPIDYD